MTEGSSHLILNLFILGNQKEVGNIDQNNNYNFGAMGNKFQTKLILMFNPKELKLKGN